MLIVTTLLVMAAGLLLAGALSLLRPVDREVQEARTRHTMDGIVHALAVYGQRHLRLPCPATPDRSGGPEPFGAERGSGPNGDQKGSCGAGEIEGIVPFRALGLSEDAARDGWGNFITYRANLYLANIPDLTANPPPKAHKACREKDVWVVKNGPSWENLNPRKAVFCCPGHDASKSSHVNVLNGVGGLAESVVPGDDKFSGYASVHAPSPKGGENTAAVAVVLVSHGRNGLGAFLDNGSRVNGSAMSAMESENADGDTGFVDRPRNEVGLGEYFDDMVAWRTSAMLYAELGGHANSCDEPLP